VAANSSGSINGSGTLTVSGTGTLVGSGRVGELVLQSGGTVNPGSSPGTLTAGNTTWAGGGNYEWEMNNATGTAGANPGWDLLDIAGDLNITATSNNKFTIKLRSLNGTSAGRMANFNPHRTNVWTLAKWTGTRTGSLSDLALDASSWLSEEPNFAKFGATQLSLVEENKELRVKYVPIAGNINGFVTRQWETYLKNGTTPTIRIVFEHATGLQDIAGYKFVNIA
ncbi:MAG: hypothetical protein ACKO3N_11545, partial [Verrucomicrobiota bacterium]